MTDLANHGETDAGGQASVARSATAPSAKGAIICSALGGLGWLALVPLLDPCDQSEQLARHFSALFNLIVISVVGGLATLVSLLGLFLSRRAKTRGNPPAAKVAARLAAVALAIGLVVLITWLPTILRILH
jgi:hypothetical protein